MQRHLTHFNTFAAQRGHLISWSTLLHYCWWNIAAVHNRAERISLIDKTDNLAESWINICNKFNGAKQHSRSPRGAWEGKMCWSWVTPKKMQHGVQSTRLLQFAVSWEGDKLFNPYWELHVSLKNCGHISVPTVFSCVYIPLARH